MNKISAIVISKNEVDRIARCIQSLSFCDEVIVLDNGSTDGTQALSLKLGAKVHEVKWKGYGGTKNLGHILAKNDWILSMDSDEKVTSSLADEISQLLLDEQSVYVFNRKNIYLGKVINHSGWSPDWVPRLFHKRTIEWNDNLVHEKLNIPDHYKKIKLNGNILHDSYRSIDEHKEKTQKYAKLKAESWISRGKKPGLLKRLLGPSFKAFQSYILRAGFLDGKAGIQIAKMNAYLVHQQLFFYDKIKETK